MTYPPTPSDATDPRRLFNSPLAFSLGHEIRKAAYTLNNLLPQPRRGGAVLEYSNSPYDSSNSNRQKNNTAIPTVAATSSVLR